VPQTGWNHDLGGRRGAAVHIQDLRMNFGDTMVLRDLSFDVNAEETFEPKVLRHANIVPVGPRGTHHPWGRGATDQPRAVLCA